MGQLKLVLLRNDIDVGDMQTVDQTVMLAEPEIKSGSLLTTFNEIRVIFSRRTLQIRTRFTQEVIELLRGGDPYVRPTQEVVEVLRLGLPYVRFTQEVIEVLRPIPKIVDVFTGTVGVSSPVMSVVAGATSVEVSTGTVGVSSPGLSIVVEGEYSSSAPEDSSSAPEDSSGAPVGDYRITEDGDYRITEDADDRIIED